MDMGTLVNRKVIVPEMIIQDPCLISIPSIVAKWSVLKVLPRTQCNPYRILRTDQGSRIMDPLIKEEKA